MAWTSTASTELDLPNGAKIYEGTFDAICGNFGHIGGTTGLDWVTWTATLDQAGAVAATATECEYVKLRYTAIVKGKLYVTGAGTSGTSIKIQGMPAAITPIATTVLLLPVGNAVVFDASAGSFNAGVAYFGLSATTALQVMLDGGTAPLGAGALSLGSSDTVCFTAMWETSG